MNGDKNARGVRESFWNNICRTITFDNSEK